MFIFGRRGYTFPYQNKFELVYFQPSKENLENYILQLERDFDGHYSDLELALKENGFTRISELFSNPDHFFDLVSKLHYGVFPYQLLGIKNLESGVIDYKFHVGIHDYHPEQGYVILQKHSDRDNSLEGYSTNRVLSLRTGKELEGDFIMKISGIENLKFEAVDSQSSDKIPNVYQIDESSQKIRLIGSVLDMDYEPLQKPYNLPFENYGIDEPNNYDFYQNDDSFISYIERRAQLYSKRLY